MWSSWMRVESRIAPFEAFRATPRCLSMHCNTNSIPNTNFTIKSPSQIPTAPSEGHKEDQDRVRLLRATPGSALHILCNGGPRRERGAEFNRMLECDGIGHIEWCISLCSIIIMFRLSPPLPHHRYLHQPWRPSWFFSCSLLQPPIFFSG